MYQGGSNSSNAIWCGTSTGGANDPTLTTPTALTLATGVALLFKLNATVTAGIALVTVNGTTKYLYSSPSGDGWLGGELVAGEIYLMVFDGALNGGAGAWRIISRYRLTPGDIPSTLGATHFPYIYLDDPAYPGVFAPDSGSSFAGISGSGNWLQSVAAFSKWFGNSHATKAGIAEHWCGAASGAAHKFYDKNAAEQFRVDEKGLQWIPNQIQIALDPTATGTINGSGAYTYLKWASIATNNCATPSGSQTLTFTKPGLAIVKVAATLAASRDYEPRILKNGGFIEPTPRKASASHCYTTLIPVTAGDYLEFVGWNYDSGTTLDSGSISILLMGGL